MRSPFESSSCEQADLAASYVLRALSPEEARGFERHLATCAVCERELATLRPVVDAFVSWPTDVLRPSSSLWGQLSARIGIEDGADLFALEPQRSDPEWEEVASGIKCKLLATDTQRDRVSMLVRLAPGVEYPPHRHAGVEELHLLDGELWIDDRKLHPGDYNIAAPGTADKRVWSETGCTCVLITSTRDALG